ncbi:hypothetical protein [Pseudaquabacterium pictum]|uniref:Lipoprotein n=1 Tax=Pseudaquabacterium pictum TaxID=2315236 RepID=A0A480ANS2_9BURK|nr:hypothetical protein [Rubrivivax pictus]GCL61712.1 hypothetical protein AQPW35_07930 [Rubrivivax pictus]
MNSMITRWQRTATLAAMLVTAALASGCAIQAAVYQPSIANVEQIKKLNPQPIKVGTFQVKSGAEGASSISLRGNPMQSPVGGDYAAYLADALRQELVLAGKFKPDAGIDVRGELLKNDIAAGGFSTNSGEIEVRFIVLRGNEERYNSVLRASDSWDSSFVGAVAIPKAQQQYPVLVQKLLTTLFADARFQAAIR